jgi:hypothetical protein
MRAFWTKDRDRNAESENAAAAGARDRGWQLTAVDRCDRCGAQAYVRVLLPGCLELLFCAHHNRQYSPGLADIAVEIQDETIRLACCALSGIRVHGRLSGGRGSAGPIRAVSGGRLGLQVLVHVVKLGVNRCLALQVLAMHPLDQLMGWLCALVVGMMAVAEQELAAGRGMLPDSPAAGS